MKKSFLLSMSIPLMLFGCSLTRNIENVYNNHIALPEEMGNVKFEKLNKSEINLQQVSLEFGDSSTLSINDIHSLYHYSGTESIKEQYVVFVKCYKEQSAILLFLKDWQFNAGIYTDCYQMEKFLSEEIKN